MNSDSSKPDKIRVDRGALNRNAAGVRGGSSSEETIEALKDRVDSVELLIEQYGQKTELLDSLSSYISDLRSELNDLRNFRFWTTIFAVLMSATLFLLLVVCFIARPDWSMMLDGRYQATLIVALGTGSVLILSILLKGIYRSRAERNDGDLLPESVKMIIEAYNSTKGQS